jgi:hypothetical protein
MFLGLGLKNRCFSFPFDFLLIVFKLGDDLLEVAPLLPCDHAYQVWWQLVLIWPQIGKIKGEAILGAPLFFYLRDSQTVRAWSTDSSGVEVQAYQSS